ncbi:uncharacterized protein BDCG_17720 [Blastomyces dermatitidis ER-3]|uniref:Uncharacterized protein n=2 Tax=Ajellomyces dermatitidis TaxID=5039 RepID=A0A0J9HGC6_AJEDA|nr:uncharacterized protein BDCG_17720 [Blastomyces dermatitidis ER-3]EEQ84761.2 hypothetical protein BDCG_17720 [Blastomyces dermatitidis ER-3]EQL36736.1 hypothetical protein BDFG_01704 [Blastomyces dermatitidis ATCC 26199]KMW68119.1 hypothetical protein BDDG_12593 [Blastomyces dermatitidis ATCC 18188]
MGSNWLFKQGYKSTALRNWKLSRRKANNHGANSIEAESLERSLTPSLHSPLAAFVLNRVWRFEHGGLLLLTPAVPCLSARAGAAAQSS